jgi:hypothetical protein
MPTTKRTRTTTPKLVTTILTMVLPKKLTRLRRKLPKPPKLLTP